MRKLTRFFSNAPTKQRVDTDAIVETSPARLSQHSDSESNFSDPSLTSDSETSSRLRPSHLLPQLLITWRLCQVLYMTTVPFVGPMPIESAEWSLELDCQRLCCADKKPCHPTQEELKRTSTKQTTKGGSSNVRTSPYILHDEGTIAFLCVVSKPYYIQS